jgi:hypothetical protein
MSAGWGTESAVVSARMSWWCGLLVRMDEARDRAIDPKDDPEYLTLSAAGKECGVSVGVLRKDRRLVEGVARTKSGHAYLHREHVPSWSQIESLFLEMYHRQLRRVEKMMKVLESEVEAVRFDLNEASAPLLLAAADVGYGQSSGRTLSSALGTLNREVLALTVIRSHLDEMGRTV